MIMVVIMLAMMQMMPWLMIAMNFALWLRRHVRRRLFVVTCMLIVSVCASLTLFSHTGLVESFNDDQVKKVSLTASTLEHYMAHF